MHTSNVIKSLNFLISIIYKFRTTFFTYYTPILMKKYSQVCLLLIKFIAILLLLLKKVSSARLGEIDIHPISPKTPAPQYQPIDRKKRKGKRV